MPRFQIQPLLKAATVSVSIVLRVISITCKTSTLTDIYNQLNNKNILDKETSDGVWLLNAGIIIEHDAKLVINEGDTKWLKMLAGETSSNIGDGNNDDTDDDSGEGDGFVHAIRVHGSLDIDSVKITSWDPAINGYIRFESDILPGREYEHTGIDAIPRPYIRVEDDATGTTNITNSEIAYLVMSVVVAVLESVIMEIMKMIVIMMTTTVMLLLLLMELE